MSFIHNIDLNIELTLFLPESKVFYEIKLFWSR